MMTLARVVADHPHAVQRDLLCHRFRYADFGMPGMTELGLRHFVAFVIGAPPVSALGQAVNEGWPKTDQLLANLAEQHAGLIALRSRYPRPGIPDTPDTPEPEVARPVTVDEVSTALTAGRCYDRFDNIADFEAKLAAARQKGVAS
jgi:hypothetical protein